MDNVTKGMLLAPLNLVYGVSPETALKILFRAKLGMKLDLDDPKTYNEKLQWIKLYDRDPLMPKCADKYLVRKYVEDRGCGSILNELYWQGFDPAEIPFDDLPRQYVVKVTHGSTFNIIVDDSSAIDRNEIVAKCRKWLKAKFLPCYGEWFYGVEKPRVVVEKYLRGDEDCHLKDYKIFCFNGVPKLVYVDTWDESDPKDPHRINAYDMDFRLLEGVELGHPSSPGNVEAKPAVFDEMAEYARRLSVPFAHARVDFYIDNGKPVFGEITFTKSAGFGRITPLSFDYEMGSWISLPKRKRG